MVLAHFPSKAIFGFQGPPDPKKLPQRPLPDPKIAVWGLALGSYSYKYNYNKAPNNTIKSTIKWITVKNKEKKTETNITEVQ